MSSLPIACELGPDQLQDRRESLLAKLVQQSSQIDRLEAGLRFRLANDHESLATALEVIQAERQCCRFLRFDLRFEPNLGAVDLDVTGSPGTLEFLVATLGLRAQTSDAG